MRISDWSSDVCSSDLGELVWRVLTRAKQIKIAGRAIRRVGPQAEKHRTLQDEAVAVLRTTQPIEQPLDAIVCHKELRIFPPAARPRDAPVADRDRDMLGSFAHPTAYRSCRLTD